MYDNSYASAMRNPILQSSQSYQNPNNIKLTVEQYQQQMQQNQQPQTNPYDDYLHTLSQCSETTRQKIIQDNRYKQASAECEELIKQSLYSEIIPKLLNYPQGKAMFERLYVVTKGLSEEYTQEEVAINQQMQMLLQDDVVLKRLQELQNQQSQQTEQKQTSKKEVKKQQIKQPQLQKETIEESGVE